MTNVRLSVKQASSAVAIQIALDRLADSGGGTLHLPAVQIMLEHGLRIRSGVTLAGAGEATVLTKIPTRVYPLAEYMNFAMCDVTLRDAAGLKPGIGGMLSDKFTYHQWGNTLATLTWVEGNRIGFDTPLRENMNRDANATFVTHFPFVWAEGASNVAVRDLVIDGQRQPGEPRMGACRAGVLYFFGCAGVTVERVHQRNCSGEGFGFQVCRDLVFRDCSARDAHGNGLHPGCGSTNVLFERCVLERNSDCGLFFCVRANHITVRECIFRDNGCGISIGNQDCHNVVEGCLVEGNRAGGIDTRIEDGGNIVHSCIIRDNRVIGNGPDGDGQIRLQRAPRDIEITGNHCDGQGKGPGIRISEGATKIRIVGNTFANCTAEIHGDTTGLVDRLAPFSAGCDQVRPEHYRHLPADVGR